MPRVSDYPLLVFGVAFLVLLCSVWVGATVCRSVWKPAEEARDDFGVILAAALTLLGLIVGFSFSMATNRYDLRKSLEEAEANAIGTPGTASRSGLASACPARMPAPLPGAAG